ncbi:MAG TPA: alpha/beta hydrolase [Phenylobacterium sp.]|nr:alpha/beta hydrolase [Phenylobacterium sp.]
MDDAVPTLTPRTVASRVLPVPGTVSPDLQRSISTLAETAGPMPGRAPKTLEQWRAMVAGSHELGLQRLGEIRALFPVEVTEHRIGGVTVREVVPADLDPAHRDRVLLHFHGGAYVIYGGESGLGEAVLGASHTRRRVLSVDYRMPPDHPFPAALDDAVAVWRELVQSHAPGSVGVFGTSAGGGLILAMALKLKALGLPLPGALAPSTPWSDLAGESDSYRVNAGVDGVLPFYEGVLEACARLYADGRSLADPLISPVHGDLAGFPPTLLTTGTRDILLSDTVRVYRRLRDAGVEARLEVYEAMSHAQYSSAFTSPESTSVFRDIGRWFDRWLSA